MLIKMNWKPSYLKIYEKENGAILVTSLTGKYITVLRSDMPNLRNYLEKMDKIQYDRMRKHGIFI